MEIWGQTDEGQDIYKINEVFGVTETGELLELNDIEAASPDNALVVDISDDYDPTAPDAAEYCKNHVVDLENMTVDGYKINLIERTIDGEPFVIANDDEDLDDDEPEIIEYNDITMSVYTDGAINFSFKNAIEKTKKANGSTIENVVKAMQDIPAETEKKLLAIAKALYHQVDFYIPFAEVKTQGRV